MQNNTNALIPYMYCIFTVYSLINIIFSLRTPKIYNVSDWLLEIPVLYQKMEHAQQPIRSGITVSLPVFPPNSPGPFVILLCLMPEPLGGKRLYIIFILFYVVFCCIYSLFYTFLRSISEISK